MPMTRVQLSTSLTDDAKGALLAELSASVAGSLGKPESYMMVVVEPETAIMMGGNDDPAALVEVRSVGTISGEQAKALSAKIGELLTQKASIPAGRIYVNFAGVPGAMWGYNGSTFG